MGEGEEASSRIPAHRIKLFTTVFACTLATAFLTVFALGSVYHPGPPVVAPTPPTVAPVDSAATPLTNTRRTTRRRERAPMWAGDPKKLLMKKKQKSTGGKNEPFEKRKTMMKHRTEVAGLPRTSLESHTAT
mmetsp:Transcript_2964/g.5788  ORF Transcript_2964/g.5788 Transcript_2964/m.5788 type:complete len:132 (+) Transcript_2964:43-438(+)